MRERWSVPDNSSQDFTPEGNPMKNRRATRSALPIAKVEATVNNDNVMVAARPDRALCRRSAHRWTKELPMPPLDRIQRLGLRLASIGSIALLCALFAPAAQAQGFHNGVQDALGPLFRDNPYAQRADSRRSRHDTTPRGMVRHWNEVAIDASGLDHTPVADGEPRVFGEQLGPARASRAMAIVHIAVFDAVNAISGHYRSYTNLPPAARN